jgi:hypothetical protein
MSRNGPIDLARLDAYGTDRGRAVPKSPDPIPGCLSILIERRTPAVAIQRWEPLREAVSLRDAMNSLLQESFVLSPSGTVRLQLPGFGRRVPTGDGGRVMTEAEINH